MSEAGFSVNEGEEAVARSPSIRLARRSSGGGGSGSAALLSPRTTLSAETADDAIAAAQARTLSGGSWGTVASGSDDLDDLERCGGRLAYFLCCSTPAVYRTDNSLPVERLNALIDALLPIVGTVMFVKYFTNVGEAEEHLAAHACEDEHDNPCSAEQACPASTKALYIATTALACVGSAVSFLALTCQRA